MSYLHQQSTVNLTSVLQGNTGNIGIVRYKTYISILISQRLRCLIVLIVEHCLGHSSVLVLAGVGQHRPHQQDADREEAHRDTEQGPLGPRLWLLIPRLLQQLLVTEDMVDRKVGFLQSQMADQLDRIVKIGGNIKQG